MTGTVKLIHDEIIIKRDVYSSDKDRKEIIKKWQEQCGFRLDICFIQIKPDVVEKKTVTYRTAGCSPAPVLPRGRTFKEAVRGSLVKRRGRETGV